MPKPDFIGKYKIIDLLGRGGMGEVYKVLDPDLNRFAALKVMLFSRQTSERQVERFKREAQILAQLSHRNIVQIFEIGEHEGKPFFVMEMLEGQTLKHKMEKKPILVDEVLKIMKVIAKAVGYLHEHRVLHRDLKPANIMITKGGDLKIMDFGLSKICDGDRQQLSKEGEVLGTLPYMSPEQIEGSKDVDGRSDVYAMGVILYELLTNTMPFQGDSAINILYQKMKIIPPVPSSRNRRVSKDMDTICLKAMETVPQDRYQTAKDFGDDIARSLEGEPIRAKPIGPWERLVRKARRNSVVSALSSLLVLVSVLALYFFCRPGQTPWEAMLKEIEVKLTAIQMEDKDVEPKVKKMQSIPVKELKSDDRERIVVLTTQIENLHKKTEGLEKESQSIPEKELTREQKEKVASLLEIMAKLQQKWREWLADLRKKRKELEERLVKEDCEKQVKNIEDAFKPDSPEEKVKEWLDKLDAFLSPGQTALSQETIMMMFFIRAQLHERLKHYENAEKDYAKFLEMAQGLLPQGNWRIRFAELKLGIVAYYRKDYDKAKRLLNGALENAPNDLRHSVIVESAAVLIQIAFASNQEDEAEKYFNCAYALWFATKNWHPDELRPLTAVMYEKKVQIMFARKEYALVQTWLAKYPRAIHEERSYMMAVCGFFGRTGKLNLPGIFESIRKDGAPKYRSRVCAFLAFLYWQDNNLAQAKDKRTESNEAKGKPEFYENFPECKELLGHPGFKKFMAGD